MDPSFFLMNKTGAPHGDTLGLINPVSKSSCNYVLSSTKSLGVIQKGAMDNEVVSGNKSMPKSTSLSRGNPSNSSGKTSG